MAGENGTRGSKVVMTLKDDPREQRLREHDVTATVLWIQIVAERIKVAHASVPMQGSVEAGPARPAQIGTLLKFVEYLRENGLVKTDTDEIPARVHRDIQKYAYIAARMGMDMGYDFDFLESGAFSTEMSLDLYTPEPAGAGAEPFARNAQAGKRFLRLVRGRGRMWLRVATFVMRTSGDIRTADEFVEYMDREGSIYDERIVRDAFESVHSMVDTEGGLS